MDVLGISRDEIVVSEVKNSANGFTDLVVVDTADLSARLLADHLILAAIDDWDADRHEEVRQLALTRVQRVTVVGLNELAAIQT